MAFLWTAGAVFPSPAGISEAVLNAGGHPAQGVSPASAGFQITLGSIGEAVGLAEPASGSLLLHGGFVGGLRPPGEVLNLRFLGPASLAWDAEPSAGVYNLYRSALGTLPGDTGSCLAAGLVLAEAVDGATPPAAGTGFFYLVTARNRIGEEGGKGAGSSGMPRLNPVPCP